MTTTTTDPAAIPGGLRGHVTNAAGQPDLTGNLAPVADELDVAGLAVTGELPPGLRGSFVRNGPNPLFEPTGRYHLLDGDGMLHGVTIADGTASYRNRWVRSRGLEAEPPSAARSTRASATSWTSRTAPSPVTRAR